MPAFNSTEASTTATQPSFMRALVAFIGSMIVLVGTSLLLASL
jgi:hypothetical protein